MNNKDNHIEKKIAKLEQEVFQLYPRYLDAICKYSNERRLHDMIFSRLEKRNYLLNHSFEFNPGQVAQIAEINDLLYRESKELLQQTNEMYKELHQRMLSGKAAYPYFRIEATLSVDYYGLFLATYPESEFEESGLLSEILDEISWENKLESYRIDSDSTAPLDDDRNKESWNEELLSHPNLISIPFFCHASHVLFTHMLYAAKDIIQIKGFTKELNVSFEESVKIT